MLRREPGWALGSEYKDVWRLELDGKGQKSSAIPRRDQAPKLIDRHINNITGESQNTSPPNFHGGTLTDAMGLGKTLSTIALIASTLKVYRDARPDNARFARHL